jgi:hypothetical protein
MCQPSANSAIDPKIDPATISPTIITAVSATTNEVRRWYMGMPGTEEDVVVGPLVN